MIPRESPMHPSVFELSVSGWVGWPSTTGDHARSQGFFEEVVLVLLPTRILGVVLVDHDRVCVKFIQVLDEVRKEHSRRACVR